MVEVIQFVFIFLVRILIKIHCLVRNKEREIFFEVLQFSWELDVNNLETRPAFVSSSLSWSISHTI